MPYIPADAESVKASLSKIQAYVRERYVPRLREGETLSVDFGELKQYPGCMDTAYDHSFGFDWRGTIWCRSGGLLDLRFIPEDDGPFCSVFLRWSKAVSLLLHWQEAKRLIEQELDKRDRERAALTAFEP